MKLRQSIYITALVLSFGLVVGCSNDDNGTYMDDDMMMGDDDMMMDDDDMMGVDFIGTFAQVDHLGRPGINTTLSFDMEGEASVKDAHNTTIPSEMSAAFQAGFQARLEQYHDVYALILGLDAATLTTVLAADVLDVAPDLPTTYFNPGTDLDNDGNVLVPDGDEVALTGRHPNDDIIDVSLILFFGGMEGDRFSGQDLDDDGMADLPRLTSDGVGLTTDISTTFPYLGAPE